MDFAMHHPFIGRRPRMRDLPLFTEADGGERRRGPRGGHRRGGRGFGPGFGGPMGAGFPPMPPGPRRGGRRRRGDVRLAALLLIAEAPRNGYQIIQELDDRTSGAWRPSPGAIYPALSQLEDEGLIRAVESAAGKTFEITDAGAAEAEAARQQPAPWEQAGADEPDPARDLMHRFGQVGQSLAAVAQSGDADLIAKASAELDDLRRRIYQLLAES